MRKAIAAIAALSLLLVGCATAVSGIASVDPQDQLEVVAQASSEAAASETSVSVPSFSSTSMTRPSTSESTVTATTSVSSTTTDEDEPTDEPTGEPTEIVPPPSAGDLSTESNGEVTFDGFQYFDFDDGLYLRWAEDYEYMCTAEQVDGCWGVLVFSVTGCADGVKVTLSISGDDSVTIGTVTGTTGALVPNNQQLLILGDATGYDGDPLAYVDSALCLGR